MIKSQYLVFEKFRNEFKSKIADWAQCNEELSFLQNAAAKSASVPAYPIENPIVYNTALDEISENDEIKLIVIGDNPGKNEQLNKNQKYLVGQAGKLGEGFFIRNPELEIDFRKNVIILNKTPVHSAKTNQLKFILKNASPKLQQIILESEKWMATETAKLHINLCTEARKENKNLPELWLVGYAELKRGGLFIPYKDELVSCYKMSELEDGCFTFRDEWNSVFVYQHFSMNRFSIDLNEHLKSVKECAGKSISVKEALKDVGTSHRMDILEELIPVL